MRSGVNRARVRSRFRWRMISCPAANEIRWVKPSMATVSPSRTTVAMASRIVATFEAVTVGDAAGSTPSAGDLTVVERACEGCLGGERDPTHRNLLDRLREKPEAGRHLGLSHRERGRHADARLATFKHQEPPLEA